MREYTVNNNDFTEFDLNPDLTLNRVDRNNTHYYTDSRCPKCGGEKYISYYNHVEGGVCFLCGGTGVHPTKVVVRTMEYDAKLEAKRLEKARKTAAARNAEYLHRQGFNADGMTWVVMGETCSRKDELKLLAASGILSSAGTLTMKSLVLTQSWSVSMTESLLGMTPLTLLVSTAMKVLCTSFPLSSFRAALSPSVSSM